MLSGHISRLQTRKPRCGSQPVVIGGGVVTQCQRIDHAATAAAIPNAMEQPAKALPDSGGVCGASVKKSRPDVTKAAIFTQFIKHCTTTTSLEALAKQHGVSTSTMKRRFSWCWLVDIPDPTIGHTGRIYDQIFIDGTYTKSGCLIVAATLDHVIA